MANQCCSYNDGGNCTDECGVNREGNSNFTCVCSNYWTGPDCDSMYACQCVPICILIPQVYAQARGQQAQWHLHMQFLSDKAQVPVV